MRETFKFNLFFNYFFKIGLRGQLCILLFFLFLTQLFSQEFVIKGNVYNKTNRQILTAVSIFDRTSLRGTITDNSGDFKISLPHGENKIEFSYTGFHRCDTIINLYENIELSVPLEPLTVSVSEVTITADRLRDHVSSSLMGSFTLTNKEMKSLPSLLGETDPIKLLQLTPGVQSGSEGNIGFYVRGGGTDQNLILYDNTLLYNPGHLLGFFSVFNPEIIKDISIIKSGIPAQFGGKASSVITLNSYKGSKDSLEIMGSLGIISSRVSIGGPIFKKRGTIIFGARRTYLDLFVEPLIRNGARKTAFLQNKSKYNFYDLNAGVSLDIGDLDNLSFSGYFGRDNFTLGRSGIKQENSLKWGNGLASLLWDHKIGENGEWTTNISRTKYNFQLAGSQSSYSFGLYSSIEDYTIKSIGLFKKNERQISTGIEFTKHSFIPNRINAQADSFLLNFGQFSTMNAIEGAVFCDGTLPVSSRFSISAGLRLSFFNHRGPYRKIESNSLGEVSDTLNYPRGKSLAFYAFPEPRLVLKYQFNPDASIKASFMRIAQYVHLATSASASLPTDIWIPSTSELKPLIGDQVSLGYFKNFLNKNIDFSVELYYKKMDNQLEFLQGIIYNSIDGNMDENIAVGYGQSYGAEFYLHIKSGKSTGWISYTLSRAEQKFNEINEGFIYPAKYDRRHDLSLTFVRKFNKKWSASAVFIYTSGNAYTLPIGRYIIQGRIVNEYGSVNSFRMPAYNRMDVSLNRTIITKKNLTSELIFSVYNIYNRANPYFIYFQASADLDKYSLKIKPVVVRLFPVIPSVSWSFKF
jgi:hypothetical protein